jgi:hypothetical protein
MPQKHNEPNVSRRGFLKAAAVTAAAATATGAGAAILRGNDQPTASLPTIPPHVTQTSVVNGSEATSELFAQLVAAQAENVQLQARLDAVQRQLAAKQTNSNEAEVLRMELDTTTQQVSLLSGLLTLYEQLEEVNLGTLLDEGLASVTTSINSLLAELPTMAEGIEAGQQALNELEDHIPLLENGRDWLDERLDILETRFGTVEQLLATAVDTAGPFLQTLNQWFQDILKWLPFNLGQRAGEIMQAIADLLTEMPHTVSGLDNHIALPLEKWLIDPTGEVPLQQQLVKPLREQVLDKASQTMVQAQDTQAVYQFQLLEPAKIATERRRALQSVIAEYRQTNQI